MKHDIDSGIQFLQQLFSPFPIAQAIFVITKLGIPDHLSAGALSANELSKLTDCHEHSLRRVLRAVVTTGIITKTAQNDFELTELGQLLTTAAPRSMRNAILAHGEIFQRSAMELSYSVQTGNEGFEKAFGLPQFEYFEANPKIGEIFDAAMQEFADMETPALVNAYDYAPFSAIADIGGGNGSFLNAILQQAPDSYGIVFDLPEVTNRTKVNQVKFENSERMRIVGGDFFDSVPQAHLYLLRHILHDWSDERAVQILRNCRRSIEKDGKLLLLESIVLENNEFQPAKWLDLSMLLVGGRERTRSEYQELLNAAEFTLDRILSTPGSLSIIEASPM